MTAERVLLTGATGFVGRRLAADFASCGWIVRAALRRPPQTSDRPLPAGVTETSVADLAGAPRWEEALADVDVVVHCAGIAHAGPGLPDDLYDRVNRQATLELARAAAGRVRRFVFMSSIRAQAGPTASDVLTESSPAHPTDAYGRSKLAAEEGLADLAIDAVSLRPVVVYGAGVKGNLALLLRLAQLPLPLPFGDLGAPRSFVSIDNLVAATLAAARETFAGHGALIVADPRPTTVAELLRAMRSGLGRSHGLLPIPHGMLARLADIAGRRDTWERLAGPMVADPSRLIGLGWQPPVASTPVGVERWLRSAPAPG